MLRDAFAAYQEAQRAADRAWQLARPGYGHDSAEAIKSAASDGQMNAALLAILDRIEIKARTSTSGHVAFCYRGDNTPSHALEYEGRTRAAAPKAKARRRGRHPRGGTV